MRFESRELTGYADYVPTDQLSEAAVYFYVAFLDDDMLIPKVEPLVFIGNDLDPLDGHKVYFQDAPSFLSGYRAYNGPGTPFPATDLNVTSVIYSFPADAGNVFSYEGAVDELLRCTLRRQRYGQDTPSIVSPVDR
jgi:hypothetical protein